MKPVLIFGAGQVAQVFAGYLCRQAHKVDAFVVDTAYWEPGKFIDGIPVVSFDNAGKVTFIPADEYLFVVGMSFRGLNAPRADKYQAMLERGFQPFTFVHPMCARNGKVGRGSFVMDLNVMQDCTEIGENCILWSGNHIGHHTKIGNHVFIASHAVIGGAEVVGFERLDE